MKILFAEAWKEGRMTGLERSALWMLWASTWEQSWFKASCMYTCLAWDQLFPQFFSQILLSLMGVSLRWDPMGRATLAPEYLRPSLAAQDSTTLHGDLAGSLEVEAHALQPQTFDTWTASGRLPMSAGPQFPSL